MNEIEPMPDPLSCFSAGREVGVRAGGGDVMDCKTALLTILDQVDYVLGVCAPNEMVAAVLPPEVIALARKAIADEEAAARGRGEEKT